MSTESASKFAWLDRLVDGFIPATIAAQREERQRARMFLISHLCGPFIGSVVPLTLFMLDPTPGYPTVVLAISIFAFWLFPPILRSIGRYNLLAFVSIQNLIFAILWSCYFYGGVSSPTLAWVLNIPLIAFMYLGQSRTLRLVFLAQFALNFLIFAAVHMFLPKVVDDTPLLALQGLGVISTLGAAGYCAMMALYYAKILASGVELETEMRGHLATAAELRSATAEAERASAAKAEFLARMSHELRTPLNAVIGYSQMLLEDAQDEGDQSGAADLERIHGAGHHLLRLVNEVLDLSKIEAGKMELTSEEVDVAALLTDIVDRHRNAAAANGDDLVLDLAPDLRTIVCDPKKTAQAISHIVDNAVKFTKDGRVVVSARRTLALEGEQIAVEVWDTGIGMAPETIPSLFENFNVAEDATSSKYGGTGLGLALSLRLCRLMGGDLSAESQLGVGSVFTIHLPTRPLARAAVADPDAWDEDLDRLQAA
ncbi:MAG: HAMP domain-containing histidine kinase [Proteobacteria bacterium]|nr:HAMP domain-containing histidine kinase [Pseudomonadota bacterium]